ncbi:MAG: MFS transporter [Phycisphaerales bacterium]|nr:MFS transporter [Phycisphaerales bacterium]
MKDLGIQNDNEINVARTQIVIASLFILFLSTIFYSHQYFFRVIPGTMQEKLTSDFKLSNFELSNVAACFFYAYLIVQPISGIVIARFGVALALLIAGISVFAGALLMSVASAVEHLYISQLLLGIGGSFAILIALSTGRTTISKKYYPLFSGGVLAIGASGAILGQAPLAYIADTYEWQDIVFYTAFLELLIVIVMTWLIFRYPHFRPHTPTRDHNKSTSSGLKETFTDSNVWLLSLLGCFLCLPMASFVIVWLYPFISLELGEHTLYSRLAPTAAYAGYVIGSPIVGWIATSLPNRKVQILIFASILGFLASMGSIYTVQHSIIIVYSLLFIMGVSISCITIIIALVRDWIPAERLPIALGIAMCALNLGGTLSLVAIGYILDIEKSMTDVPQLKAYHVALVFVPASFLMALAFSCLIQLRATRRVRSRSQIKSIKGVPA